jgi:hypothetical protein
MAPSLLALQAGLPCCGYLTAGPLHPWLAGLAATHTVQFAQPFPNLNTLAAVQQLEQQWPAD